ncbi:LPD7 domain-containing protein [Herbaspirillum huttiense]|uniref:LPD7 domain-containing protein n=1 Tax=Herbaspirillum huttiense TaxID=863372 RepID=UPI0038090DBB
MAVEQNTIKQSFTGPVVEPLTGIVEAFGQAPREFNAELEQSYFVTLNVDGKSQTIWGRGLEDTYLKTYVSIGDKITVRDMGMGSRNVPSETWDGKQFVASERQENLRLWEVDHLETAGELAREPVSPRKKEDATIRHSVDESDGLSNAASNPPKNRDESKQPEKLAEGAFVRNAKGEYCPAGSRKAKIVDGGDMLTVKSDEVAVFQATLELVKAKGWLGIDVSGTKEFKAEAWFHAMQAGIRVNGYEPDENDLKRWKVHLSENERSDRENRQPNVIRKEAEEITSAAKAAVTEHTFDGNYRDAVDFVMKKGAGVRAINLKQDSCSGPVVFQNETHFVQHLGRDKYVVHDRSKISGIGVEDAKLKSLRVVYSQGQGKADQAKEKSKGLSR